MRLLITAVLVLTMRSSAGGAPSSPSKPLLSTKKAPDAVAIRRIVLCTLAVQNAGQMLTMRYSRMPGQPRYLSSTAVALAELVKIAVSILVLVHQQGAAGAAKIVWSSGLRDTLVVGVPALLYLLQNNLLYVATSHLDAATCQVGYQLKLLTTAFFSVTLLQRKIPLRRWLALGLLFVGVVLVQYPGAGGGAAASAAAHAAAQNPVVGMAAVAAACMLSGLAGVWLERIVKSNADVPLMLRNIQLGAISLVLSAALIFANDGAAVRAGGLFQGYTWVTLFVVFQVSVGGLLVAMVMKYADNVVKGFATSLSIVLSSVVSAFIPALGFQPSIMFVAGSTLVILATLLYSQPPKPAPKVASPSSPSEVVDPRSPTRSRRAVAHRV